MSHPNLRTLVAMLAFTSICLVEPACIGAMLLPMPASKPTPITPPVAHQSAPNPMVGTTPLTFTHEVISAHECQRGSVTETFEITVNPSQICLSVLASNGQKRGYPSAPWAYSYVIEVDGKRVGPMTPTAHGSAQVVNECMPPSADEIRLMWQQLSSACVANQQVVTRDSKKLTLGLAVAREDGSVVGQPTVEWTFP
jgi:hypothetical protein